MLEHSTVCNQVLGNLNKTEYTANDTMHSSIVMIAEIEGFLLKIGTAMWEKIAISNKTGSSNVSNMFYCATVVASAAIFL